MATKTRSKKIPKEVIPEVPAFSESELEASICKDSFWEFVKCFWEEVPGAGKMISNWHMEVLANELQVVAERVFKGEVKQYDEIFNVSPGTSKSTIGSILFPAWVWCRMPSARILTASHTDALVLDLANKSRTVIKSEKYGKLFPYIVISSEQDTKGYFTNTLGGDRLTCTVAGKSPVGFHADFQVVDDPIDPKKAVSETELKAANYFFDAVLPGRMVNKEVGVMFLIMQRLHSDDPTGHILARSKEAGKIRHICLPGELSDNVSPVELREKYTDGLMDPMRLNKDLLKRYRILMGEYAFSGQFMQSPVPLSGGMFKLKYFSQRVKAAPYRAKRIRYWDRAATQDAGCYTAGVLMALDDEGSYFIEHVVHGQWEPDERNKVMKVIALQDRGRYGPKHEPAIWVEREGGSSGRDAWKGVARALAGFNIREHRVTGKKEVRAEPWSAQLAALNVYIVDNGESTGSGRSDWDINNFVTEHCLFPFGRVMDQVDAAASCFSLLVGSIYSAGLRTMTISHGNEKRPILRVVVCSENELANLVIEQRCLLLSIQDPPPLLLNDNSGGTIIASSSNLVKTGLAKCLDHLTLSFADLDPEDLQDAWDTPIPPFYDLPEKLIMNREQGKKLWKFLLTKRDIPYEVIIIVDDEERRALSIAYALSETIKIPKCMIYLPRDPDFKKGDEQAPNGHIYSVAKSSRGLVV